jgi:hypothetical protein
MFKAQLVRSLSSSRRGGSVVLMTAALFVLSGLRCPAAAYAQMSDAPEPHTEAAVIADDEAWGKAEAGDVAYVDNLLLPEYRSVNPDGSVHPKEAIVGSVRKRANSPALAAAYKADTEKWLAAHPYTTKVVLIGDTAILTFSPDNADAAKPVRSCDIFVYREGHWKAIYSQHTDAAGK